ncbi:LpxL/LpxP family Kdo(2)-lipid IV(A) lauroyl/palmitoleoyl acyltransferase [Pragia fontium]|uniref:Lipid A biosynthesis acyltransferase n=1 Tax=Pragia fontium DSM 5563 = ATCC 49100 TaxID=1122977 RepID=A0AAJ5BGU8_9GAMM|nr:LpxL/LpxP family Kdo(2)-lipid IV(A) lauroyl/palmitoleoyl acyltransferase [Pragia fontium]SFC64177.1 KDO2-lipid IV(A) lauroyltransferase [Pragia fontium DSM 5563 = ATCC 49100]SUB83619.1 Lipid A biosynthesis lauroyl acyltransferase [Pragia fontium]VEJ56524.1 Lipid A biosynthesis lauroyl acyltransferase [Pragia fontium]
MSKNHIRPEFTRDLLHPRYWLLWLGIGVLYLLVLLPYPWINSMGRGLGRFAMRFMKRRKKISKSNIQLCFPDMTEEEHTAWMLKNFEATGLAVFETGMAWFWPDWRIEKWCTIKGINNLDVGKTEQRGVLVIGIHFLTLELGARIIGIHRPGVGVYRPHDNKLMDWLQTWGRLRSNKYMLDRRDIKGMIRSLKKGELIWYAPDHDYGPRNSVFAPFFAVEKAATTIGTTILVRAADPLLVPFIPMRNEDNSGYSLIVQPPLEGFPKKDEVAAAAFMNKAIEQQILIAPEQYMWLHRRFKTRPEGEPSLYQ